MNVKRAEEEVVRNSEPEHGVSHPGLRAPEGLEREGAFLQDTRRSSGTGIKESFSNSVSKAPERPRLRV